MELEVFIEYALKLLGAVVAFLLWFFIREFVRKHLYKDDKLMAGVVWKPNGEKCPVSRIVNGNGVAVMYKDDGPELFRATYKDGQLVKD